MPTDQVNFVSARALYDNVAETSDELEFKKGDILTVLKQNHEGLEGWWFCSFQGKQGICPGNRLKILTSANLEDTHVADLRKPNDTHFNKVITPKKIGECYAYDVSSFQTNDCISTESNAVLIAPIITEDSKCERMRFKDKNAADECVIKYDVPKRCPSRAFDVDSLCRPSKSALAEYDVPKSRPVPVITASLGKINSSEARGLSFDAAIKMLVALESAISNSISSFISYFGPAWREQSDFHLTITDVKSAAYNLQRSLQSLYEFSDLITCRNSSNIDTSLKTKLQGLSKTLNETRQLFCVSFSTLESCEWNVEPANENCNLSIRAIDALDQLIAIVRSLTEDIRQFTSFVQGNARLLFEKTTFPNDVTQNSDSENCSNNVLEDSVKGDNDDYTTIDAITEKSSEQNNDKPMLAFYVLQCTTLTAQLMEVIDALLNAVENNHPPKAYLTMGKLVVVSAYRLVHMGDSISTSVDKQTLSKIIDLVNTLSDSLTITCRKIGIAALQFPNVASIQDMVDALVDISHITRDLKLLLMFASQK